MDAGWWDWANYVNNWSTRRENQAIHFPAIFHFCRLSLLFSERGEVGFRVLKNTSVKLICLYTVVAHVRDCVFRYNVIIKWFCECVPQLLITEIPTDGRRQQQVAVILVLTDSVILNKRESCLLTVRNNSSYIFRKWAHNNYNFFRGYYFFSFFVVNSPHDERLSRKIWKCQVILISSYSV